MRPAKPFVAPDWAWHLAIAAGVAGAIVGGQLAGLGGMILGVAPSVGIMVTMGVRPEEVRKPTQQEMLTIIDAARLTGLTLPHFVRLPRTRRIWVDRILTGGGITLAMIVIGIVAL